MAAADFEDSNIALLGSDLEKEVRKTAAETVAAYKGAGESEGITVWRIENFKVVPWPEKQYGSFYAGDSYIILNTYKVEDKLKFNIHFWLGESTSQDEAGVAAYMTVVLDDLLGTEPVQYREVQAHESDEFLALWKNGVRIMQGGVDGGFNHVPADKYATRLLRVKGKAKNLVVSEVTKAAASMNHGDIFIVDAGLKLYQWNGSASGPFEKNKAANVCAQIDSERDGQAQIIVVEDGDENDEFWAALGEGGAGDVADAGSAGDDEDAKANDDKRMFKISDASGELVLTEVDFGAALGTNDAFVVDAGSRVFAWVGKGASKNEKRIAMRYATDYLARHGRPLHTPISKILEGNETDAFNKARA